MEEEGIRDLALDLYPEEELKLRELLNGHLDPTRFTSVQTLIARCHHEPDREDLVLEACNELLDGFGIEALRGAWLNDRHSDVQASYVNLGDSYIPTVIRDHARGCWLVDTTGDFVEAHPERFETTAPVDAEEVG